MKLIYATTNIQKKKQIENFFKASSINDIEFISLKEIGFTEEIIEDGKTLEENSMIKAKAARKFCDENGIKEIVVADDTGLFVDCLNGAPGVYSARYVDANGKATQEQSIQKLLREVNQTGDKDRTAKFRCILTLIFPDGRVTQVEGKTLGKIALKPGAMGKLTYGPIFIPDGFDRVMNELEDSELGNTHREKAFLELIKILKNS